MFKNLNFKNSFQISNFKFQIGFTLVELLVVASILALFGLVAYANLRNFRSSQVIEKSASDLQSFLRLAQSNASSRLNCNGLPGATWVIQFFDRQTINLRCYVDDPSSATTQGNPLSFSGTNIQVNLIQGRPSNCPSSFTTSTATAIEIRFAPLYGTVTFYDPGVGCLTNASTTGAAITLRDTQRNTTKVVVVKIGGEINVE